MRITRGFPRLLLGSLLVTSLGFALAGTASAVDRGQEFLRVGKLDKAKAYYEEWMAKDPESVDAMAGYGSVLIAYGDFEGAMDLLEKGLDLQKDHYDLNLNLGRAYYYKGKDLADMGRSAVSVGSLLRDAARTTQQAIDANPERYEGWQSLGMIQQYQSEFPQSIESFKKATILKPDDAFSWYQLGQSCQFAEKYEDAITAYIQAAQTYEDGYYDAYHQAGVCYQWLEDEDNASAMYVKAIDVSPETLTAWDSLWNLYAAQKKFGEAAVVYTKLTKQHPKNAYIRLVLGSVYAYDQKHEEALGQFKKALDLARTADLKAAGYYQLGLTYRELGKPSKAEDAFKRSLKVSPEFEDPIAILSGMAREMSDGGGNNYKGAARILEFLAEFKKTDGFVWSDLGLVYRDWGKYKKAAEAYEKAVKFEPFDAQILNDYAVVLDYHFDRVEEAYPLYVQAIELENNVDAMQNLTRLYIKQGKYEEAVQLAEQALELDSSRAIIRTMLDDAKRKLAQKAG